MHIECDPVLCLILARVTSTVLLLGFLQWERRESTINLLIVCWRCILA